MSKQVQHIPTGHKSSLLGPIPKDWEVKRLGEISEIGSGGTPSKKNSNYWNGNIPWITTSLINHSSITRAEEYITEEGLSNSSAKILSRGVLLMAMYGQGQTRGRVAKLEIEAATNQACAYINITKGFNDFIYQYLMANYERIRNESNDGNQKNLSLGIIGQIIIPFPPLLEQQKIAEILSTWDKAIELQTTLIEKLTLRKKGLMQQLLSGKKRLKGFSEPWNKNSYGNMLQEICRNVEWDDNELYDLISVRRRSEGIFRRESLYGREILTKGLGTVKEGDFIISKMQIVHGASALVTEEYDGAKVSGSYIVLIPRHKNSICMEYFNYYSQTPRFYHQTFLSSYGVHIEKMTFDLSVFFTYEMLLPPCNEQIAIAKALKTTDHEIEIEKQKLEALKQQKKGLMQQLLTGKKRVITK